jgi:hypothetical protein
MNALSEFSSFEIERLRAEALLWEARAIASFWRLPETVRIMDLREDVSMAREALAKLVK